MYGCDNTVTVRPHHRRGLADASADAGAAPELDGSPDPNLRATDLGSHDATGRAFHRADEVRVYWFGLVAYRDTSSRTLGEQFRITLEPASQFWDRAPDAGDARGIACCSP
jgi:hypothetical protein